MTSDLLWKFGTALVAAATMLLGIGRYVGQIEQRLAYLEAEQRFYHGEPPKEAK